MLLAGQSSFAMNVTFQGSPFFARFSSIC
jgi:hypothetical protein